MSVLPACLRPGWFCLLDPATTQSLALDAFLLKSGMIVMEVSPRITDIAFDAYRKYGKGSDHEAALNYGDCFSYASAKYLAAPLLFKGDDFSKTDIGAT